MSVARAAMNVLATADPTLTPGLATNWYDPTMGSRSAGNVTRFKPFSAVDAAAPASTFRGKSSLAVADEGGSRSGHNGMRFVSES